VNYTIRPSIDVDFQKAPTVALASPTGGGKTESAMRLARGYVGPKGKFLVIDTEEKRALYKRKRYQPWDWMDLQPPFTPQNYIAALEKSKDYDAVIVDSGSHEYSGPGGMQDMQLEDLERMSKGDPARMEKLTAPAWKRAKLEHKKLMASIIRYPKLLIVCLRAEPKIKFVKDEHGKTQIVDAGYQPICERMFMYEMLVGCMLHSDNPGVPNHIKRLEPDLEPVFIAGKQIDESTGERLAAWASTKKAASQDTRKGVNQDTPADTASDCLSEEQHDKLAAALSKNNKSAERLLRQVSKQYGTKVDRLDQILAADFVDAMEFAESP
jgi:hypothetical protein